MDKKLGYGEQQSVQRSHHYRQLPPSRNRLAPSTAVSAHSCARTCTCYPEPKLVTVFHSASQRQLPAALLVVLVVRLQRLSWRRCRLRLAPARMRRPVPLLPLVLWWRMLPLLLLLLLPLSLVLRRSLQGLRGPLTPRVLVRWLGPMLLQWLLRPMLLLLHLLSMLRRLLLTLMPLLLILLPTHLLLPLLLLPLTLLMLRRRRLTLLLLLLLPVLLLLCRLPGTPLLRLLLRRLPGRRSCRRVVLVHLCWVQAAHTCGFHNVVALCLRQVRAEQHLQLAQRGRRGAAAAAGRRRRRRRRRRAGRAVEDRLQPRCATARQEEAGVDAVCPGQAQGRHHLPPQRHETQAAGQRGVACRRRRRQLHAAAGGRCLVRHGIHHLVDQQHCKAELVCQAAAGCEQGGREQAGRQAKRQGLRPVRQRWRHAWHMLGP